MKDRNVLKNEMLCGGVGFLFLEVVFCIVGEDIKW